MFIQNLDVKQQSALLYLAKQIIDADDKIDSGEAEIFTILMSQVKPSVAPTSISVTDLGTLFDSNRSKASLLLELIGVAHADGDYHIKERALIESYAEAIDVSLKKLEQLEKWVVKQLSLSLEAQALLA